MANNNIPILSLNDNDVFIIAKLLSKQLNSYKDIQSSSKFSRYLGALRAVLGLGYTAILATECKDSQSVYHELLQVFLGDVEKSVNYTHGFNYESNDVNDLNEAAKNFAQMIFMASESFLQINYPLYFDAFRNNLCIALGGLHATDCDCCNMGELSSIFTVICKH